MNIKDIKNISQLQETNDSIDDSPGRRVESPGRTVSSPTSKLVQGMSPTAHLTYKSMEHQMTKQELGISNKRIVIPSFETTSKLFAQHFAILRALRHRIDML